jgi:hypothetical protein
LVRVSVVFCSTVFCGEAVTVPEVTVKSLGRRMRSELPIFAPSRANSSLYYRSMEAMNALELRNRRTASRVIS